MTIGLLAVSVFLLASVHSLTNVCIDVKREFSRTKHPAFARMPHELTMGLKAHSTLSRLAGSRELTHRLLTSQIFS